MQNLSVAFSLLHASVSGPGLPLQWMFTVRVRILPAAGPPRCPICPNRWVGHGPLGISLPCHTTHLPSPSIPSTKLSEHGLLGARPYFFADKFKISQCNFVEDVLTHIFPSECEELTADDRQLTRREASQEKPDNPQIILNIFLAESDIRSDFPALNQAFLFKPSDPPEWNNATPTFAK